MGVGEAGEKETIVITLKKYFLFYTRGINIRGKNAAVTFYKILSPLSLSPLL